MKQLFLALLILKASVMLKAQGCTPFLGGDRQVIPCSSPFSINYYELFLQPASTSFVNSLLPPVDTVKGVNGQPDSLIQYLSKTKTVATRADGCKDSAIVRVILIFDPLPNLGADKTVYLH